MRKPLVAAVVSALLLAIAGCGESEGVAEGATVSAYVVAPLCVGAEQELASEGGRAGSIRIRAVCLPNVRNRGGLDLATTGVNARRATEDSTTIGYLEAPDPAVARFTEPILESAGIARISQSTGKAAMARLLQAIEASDSGSLRESIREAVNEA